MSAAFVSFPFAKSNHPAQRLTALLARDRNVLLQRRHATSAVAANNKVNFYQNGQSALQCAEIITPPLWF